MRGTRLGSTTPSSATTSSTTATRCSCSAWASRSSSGSAPTSWTRRRGRPSAGRRSLKCGASATLRSASLASRCPRRRRPRSPGPRPSSATPARRPSESSRGCARPPPPATPRLAPPPLPARQPPGAPGIDIIIGAHEHTLLQSSSAGVPIFKMTADARELGRFDLNIDPATGKVQSIDWQIIPVNESVEDDVAFAPAGEKYAKITTELSAPVGRTTVPLDARRATSRTEETNIADFIAASFRRASGADVALINGGSIRADDVLPAGDLAVRDVLSILPFGNNLSVLDVTGEVLRQALEHGVSLTGPGAEPGPFPQVSGLTFRSEEHTSELQSH